MLFTYVGILAVAVLVAFFAYSNLTKGSKVIWLTSFRFINVVFVEEINSKESRWNRN